MPSELQRWMRYRGSMTRLMKRSQRTLRIEVLAHHLARPTPAESRLLSVDNKLLCLTRDIIMHCQNQPWLYARVVMPLPSLKGKYRRLLRLGSIPLGKVLFKDPQVTRSEFEFFTESALALPGELAQGRDLFARRSQFHLPYGPILLTEVCLPAMEQSLC